MDTRYAVVLEPDEDAFQVIVPAFPEIHTFGETVEDALAMVTRSNFRSPCVATKAPRFRPLTRARLALRQLL
jgi:hypothetical protein